MKKVLSITLSLIIIVTACLGFGTVALANNYSSAQAIQEELNLLKQNIKLCRRNFYKKL